VRDLARRRASPALRGHQGPVTCLAFSPGGRLLASGGRDCTAVLWDVDALRRDTLPPAKVPARADVEPWWADLGSQDGERAYRAVQGLASAPGRAVPLIAECLPPELPVTARHIARLIADLGSEDFATRRAAERELTRLGPRAERALRKKLAERPDLEVHARVRRLLAALDPRSQPEKRLRAHRAVEVLEAVNDGPARAFLRKLAAGPADSPLTQDARASLARCERRAAALR
jgi:hypothetical protein